MFSYIWHTFFFDPVYNILVFFIDVIPGGDVGLAIIATVIVVKLILLPVSIKAIQTQKIMKEILNSNIFKQVVQLIQNKVQEI